jgi:hypothetical protein
MLSHGSVIPDSILIKPPFSALSPLILPYRNFSNTIIHRPIPIMNSNLYDDIYNRIIQPYNADTFDTLLSQHNITHLYPVLTRNLRTSFPLGAMPALTQTVILNNHPSTLEYPETVNGYLADEVEAGRMTGPYSRAEVEMILCGPFFSSPLIVSVQPQGLGIPDKLHVCRHLSKSNKTTTSVNSHVKKEDFPTRFNSASCVADTVSFLYLFQVYFWYLESSWSTSGTSASDLLLAGHINRVYFW